MIGTSTHNGDYSEQRFDTLPDYSLAPEQVPLVGSLALDDAERDH